MQLSLVASRVMVFESESRGAWRRALGVLSGVLCLSAGVPLVAFGLIGLSPIRSDGVYTKAQAERGRVLFDAECAECHGAKLEGGTSTPLAGPEFVASWAKPALTLDDFYYIVRKTMPKEQPASLPRESYLDIVAFILQQNGLPDGEKELTPDPVMMRAVRFGTTVDTAPPLPLR